MFRLKEDLESGKVVTVTFEKADGTERVMKCVSGPEICGESYEYKGAKPKSDDTLSVWDIEKEAWRSFRINSVINWTVEA